MADTKLNCISQQPGNNNVEKQPIPEQLAEVVKNKQAPETFKFQSQSSYFEMKFELHLSDKNPTPKNELPFLKLTPENIKKIRDSVNDLSKINDPKPKGDKRKVVVLDADDEYEVDTSMLDKGCKIVEKRNKDGSSTTTYDYNQDGIIDLEIVRLSKKDVEAKPPSNQKTEVPQKQPPENKNSISPNPSESEAKKPKSFFDMFVDFFRLRPNNSTPSQHRSPLQDLTSPYPLPWDYLRYGG